MCSPLRCSLCVQQATGVRTKTQQVKFSDDTSLTGLITTGGNTPGCRGEDCGLVQGQIPSSQRLKDQGDSAGFHGRSKEIMLDFTRDLPTPCPLVINGEKQVLPAFHHRLPERLGLLNKRKPVHVLRKETEYLQSPPQGLYLMKRLNTLSLIHI